MNNIRTLLFGVLGLTTQCLGHKVLALPNPASVHCAKVGGSLLMAKDGKGGVYGICVFKKDYQCEEWALFHGDCPVGGINIGGYATQEAIFCAIRGGAVLQDETQCQLPSGQVCPIEDFYARQCA
jgi:putative hemolysin